MQVRALFDVHSLLSNGGMERSPTGERLTPMVTSTFTGALCFLSRTAATRGLSKYVRVAAPAMAFSDHCLGSRGAPNATLGGHLRAQLIEVVRPSLAAFVTLYAAWGAR